MHVNTHFALGVIISVLLVVILQLTLPPVLFLITVLAACVPDGDYAFSRYARNHNHRWLPTHTIYPGLVGTIISAIWLVLQPGNQFAATILIGSVNVMGHVVSDGIDWGVNLFYMGRLLGPKLLLEGMDDEQISKKMGRDPAMNGRYFLKYYRNRIMLSIELCLLLLMIVSIILGAGILGTMGIIGIVCGYTLALGYHIVQLIRATRLAGKNT